MRIDEKIEKIGYFWLPEHSNIKVSGRLTIEDGGNIQLEILGSFDQWEILSSS